MCVSFLQVYSLVLQGRVEETRRLLSVHSRSNSDAFRSLDELLHKMPLFSQVSPVPKSAADPRLSPFVSEDEFVLRHSTPILHTPETSEILLLLFAGLAIGSCHRVLPRWCQLGRHLTRWSVCG